VVDHSLIKNLASWALLLIFLLLCFFSQIEKSVTVDEFSHFPSGIYNLLTMDWSMDSESPPLIKCYTAITSIFTQPKINIIEIKKTKTNAWGLGYQFMFSNAEQYHHIFQYGRCAIILLGCFLGWLVYRFGTYLYGQVGGLFALFLYVFNPNIIAHSSLITIDIGASCFIFLSIYCFWLYLKKKDIASIVLAGFSLGLAQLSKFTALLLYPVFFVIISFIVIEGWILKKGRNEILLKDICGFLIIILISLIIINAGYFFSGSFRCIGDYHLSSNLLHIISTWLWDSFPVPLPFDYLTGFDNQLALSEGGVYTSFLMGEHSMEGWWNYYLIAFIIKNPLALLLILILTITFWKRNSHTEIEDHLCIWVPMIMYLIYFSFFTDIPIGVRYILPVFPLIFIAAGSLVTNPIINKKTGKLVVTILAFAYLLPTFLVYPNYFSYFNIIAGGPENGHKWLIDSNLDWGQDLPGLKKYMDRKGIEEIKLGYFGRVDPELYGIKYTVSNGELEPGIHAISINYLVGYPYFILKNNPKGLINVDLDYFKKFRTLKPVDIINNTIYIFRIK
jgi:hypothetical protein